MDWAGNKAMLHKQEIIGSEVEDTDPINVNDSPSQRRIIRKVELNPPFATPLLPTRSTYCEAVTGGQGREALSHRTEHASNLRPPALQSSN